jgi:hypothetical protein
MMSSMNPHYRSSLFFVRQVLRALGMMATPGVSEYHRVSEGIRKRSGFTALKTDFERVGRDWYHAIEVVEQQRSAADRKQRELELAE